MGYTTSAWQSWWAVDWHTGFVLQFSICSAPANFQTDSMLLSWAQLTDCLAHLCPPPAIPFQPSSLWSPVTYTRFMLLSQSEETTGDIVGDIPYSAISCCHTPAVSRKLREQHCMWLVRGTWVGHSSTLHHSLQWGQSSSSGGGQAVRLSIP